MSAEAHTVRSVWRLTWHAPKLTTTIEEKMRHRAGQVGKSLVETTV